MGAAVNRDEVWIEQPHDDDRRLDAILAAADAELAAAAAEAADEQADCRDAQLDAILHAADEDLLTALQRRVEASGRVPFGPQETRRSHRSQAGGTSHSSWRGPNRAEKTVDDATATT